MNDLGQWLREQLDKDERIARRAGDSFRQIGETGVIVATEGDRAEECASANWAGVAEHIVEHDPARVLREIDAKRGLVASYERAWNTCARLGEGGIDFADVEEWKRQDQTVLVLKPHVRNLAALYADRPGYREEWRQ